VRSIAPVLSTCGRSLAAVGQPLALSDGPNDLAIIPDGRALYIMGDGVVVRVPVAPATGVLAISPDRRNLYVGGEDGIQLIRLH